MENRTENYDDIFNDFNSNEKKIYRFITVYQKILSRKGMYGSEELTVVETHTLSEIDDTPGITVTQLAQHWFRTLGAISQTIHRLEEKKLIYRESDLDNSKVMHLFVTEKGKDISNFHKKHDIEILKTLHKELRKSATEEELSKFYQIIENYTNYIVESELGK